LGTLKRGVGRQGATQQRGVGNTNHWASRSKKEVARRAGNWDCKEEGYMDKGGATWGIQTAGCRKKTGRAVAHSTRVRGGRRVQAESVVDGGNLR